MAEFLLLYRGAARPTSEGAGQQLASRWGGWLRRIAARGALVAVGDPVVGGRIGANSANIEPGKDYVSGDDYIGGYSRISAANIDPAAALCADCPILGEGGFVNFARNRDDGRLTGKPFLPSQEMPPQSLLADQHVCCCDSVVLFCAKALATAKLNFSCTDFLKG